jgi:hypothetical protein
MYTADASSPSMWHSYFIIDKSDLSPLERTPISSALNHISESHSLGILQLIITILQPIRTLWIFSSRRSRWDLVDQITRATWDSSIDIFFSSYRMGFGRHGRTRWGSGQQVDSLFREDTEFCYKSALVSREGLTRINLSSRRLLRTSNRRTSSASDLVS